MRKPVLILLAASAALIGCSGNAAPSDADTVDLVKSIVPTNEGCSEGSGGRLVTCEAHTRDMSQLILSGIRPPTTRTPVIVAMPDSKNTTYFRFPN